MRLERHDERPGESYEALGGKKKITLAQAIQAIFQSHAVADPSEEETIHFGRGKAPKMLKCPLQDEKWCPA